MAPLKDILYTIKNPQQLGSSDLLCAPPPGSDVFNQSPCTVSSFSAETVSQKAMKSGLISPDQGMAFKNRLKAYFRENLKDTQVDTLEEYSAISNLNLLAYRHTLETVFRDRNNWATCSVQEGIALKSALMDSDLYRKVANKEGAKLLHELDNLPWGVLAEESVFKHWVNTYQDNTFINLLFHAAKAEYPVDKALVKLMKEKPERMDPMDFASILPLNLASVNEYILGNGGHPPEIYKDLLEKARDDEGFMSYSAILTYGLNHAHPEALREAKEIILFDFHHIFVHLSSDAKIALRILLIPPQARPAQVPQFFAEDLEQIQAEVQKALPDVYRQDNNHAAELLILFLLGFGDEDVFHGDCWEHLVSMETKRKGDFEKAKKEFVPLSFQSIVTAIMFPEDDALDKKAAVKALVVAAKLWNREEKENPWPYEAPLMRLQEIINKRGNVTLEAMQALYNVLIVRKEEDEEVEAQVQQRRDFAFKFFDKGMEAQKLASFFETYLQDFNNQGKDEELDKLMGNLLLPENNASPISPPELQKTYDLLCLFAGSQTMTLAEKAIPLLVKLENHSLYQQNENSPIQVLKQIVLDKKAAHQEAWDALAGLVLKDKKPVVLEDEKKKKYIGNIAAIAGPEEQYWDNGHVLDAAQVLLDLEKKTHDEFIHQTLVSLDTGALESLVGDYAPSQEDTMKIFHQLMERWKTNPPKHFMITDDSVSDGKTSSINFAAIIGQANTQNLGMINELTQNFSDGERRRTQQRTGLNQVEIPSIVEASEDTSDAEIDENKGDEKVSDPLQALSDLAKLGNVSAFEFILGRFQKGDISMVKPLKNILNDDDASEFHSKIIDTARETCLQFTDPASKRASFDLLIVAAEKERPGCWEALFLSATEHFELSVSWEGLAKEAAMALLSMGSGTDPEQVDALRELDIYLASLVGSSEMATGEYDPLLDDFLTYPHSSQLMELEAALEKYRENRTKPLSPETVSEDEESSTPASAREPVGGEGETSGAEATPVGRNSRAGAVGASSSPGNVPASPQNDDAPEVSASSGLTTFFIPMPEISLAFVDSILDPNQDEESVSQDLQGLIDLAKQGWDSARQGLDRVFDGVSDNQSERDNFILEILDSSGFEPYASEAQQILSSEED
ncbi:MAG TPA: hypothetical protein DDW49_02045 [Deltaproteobacteria bacterium]|nr:MAG: hypothetical protein A2048_10005 [Deltaproteobacteria bacterium GWA2_45_12]HBF12166.1 hypothetical protein [Deltaproteobacteria bacterium]